MTEEIQVMSKVLVYETDDVYSKALKGFFAENNLIGLRAGHHKGILDALKSNIDLGAVFICDDKLEEDGMSSLDLALEIHTLRSELPIFLRKSNTENLEARDKAKSACAAFYRGEDMEQLKALIDRYLFNTHYPSKFIRGVEEVTETAIQGVFRDVTVSCSFPYLVRDRLIFGEMFSIMALESNWCRGFMMLQSEEGELAHLINTGKTALTVDSTDFRSINNLLSEITNMIWGSFKTRFFASDEVQDVTSRIQVPIIVNHSRKYISFGADDPQLCFQYSLQDSQGNPPISIYQKFAFNLTWSPDDFVDSSEAMEELVEAGELELF